MFDEGEGLEGSLEFFGDNLDEGFDEGDSLLESLFLCSYIFFSLALCSMAFLSSDWYILRAASSSGRSFLELLREALQIPLAALDLEREDLAAAISVFL